MTPYRSPAPMPRPIVHFGNKRRALWTLALGWLFVVVPIASIVMWLHWGGRISFNLFGLDFLGVGLIARAKWGELELDRARGVLVVIRRGVLGGKRIEVPVANVEGLRVVRTSVERGADYSLDLVTREGADVQLGRAAKEAALEADRAALGDFLLEHRLLGEGAR